MSPCPFVPRYGRDVDMDGFIWPGSPYDLHLDSPEHAAETSEEPA